MVHCTEFTLALSTKISDLEVGYVLNEYQEPDHFFCYNNTHCYDITGKHLKDDFFSIWPGEFIGYIQYEELEQYIDPETYI